MQTDVSEKIIWRRRGNKYCCRYGWIFSGRSRKVARWPYLSPTSPICRMTSNLISFLIMELFSVYVQGRTLEMFFLSLLHSILCSVLIILSHMQFENVGLCLWGSLLLWLWSPIIFKNINKNTLWSFSSW